MSTNRAQLRTIIAGLLSGQTAAGASVYTPGDWATYTGEYPVILVSSPGETKESFGERGEVEFLVTATIRIVGKVQVGAAAGDFGMQAEQAAEALQLQVEPIVIGNPAIRVITSQTSAVRTKFQVSAEGEQQIGEFVMELDLEFYQGPEDFYVSTLPDLTTVQVDLDLQNVFDPTGTYADPPFPDAVTPAPRTSGPDGREEGGLTITLPGA